MHREEIRLWSLCRIHGARSLAALSFTFANDNFAQDDLTRDDFAHDANASSTIALA